MAGQASRFGSPDFRARVWFGHNKMAFTRGSEAVTVVEIPDLAPGQLEVEHVRAKLSVSGLSFNS
jgi:hypothetical protein